MSLGKVPLYAALTVLAAAAWANPAFAAGKRGPLTVKPTLSTRVASATIGTKGGTLTVRTASGARVTLTIPANSIAQDTPVTMTAVSRLRGLPFKRQPAAAVALAPDGLRLLRGATLTVTPKRPMARSRRAAVAWLAAGRDAHLYPAARSAKIKLALTHFSGYAVGQATPAEQHALAAHTPADPVARSESNLATFINGHGDLDSQEFQELLAEWALPQYRVLAALLKRAETDDTIAVEAIGRAIGLERPLALLGVTNGGVFQFTPPRTHDKQLARELEKLAAAMRRSVPRVFDNLYRQAKRRCVTDHQPGQAQRILSIARELSLIGRTEVSFETALRDVYRCQRYTLEFSSSFTDAFALRAYDCQDALPGSQAIAVQGSAISSQPANGTAVRPEGTGSLTAQSASYDLPGEAQCGPGSIWSDPSTYTILSNNSPGQLRFQPDVLWDDPVGVQVPNARVRSVALVAGSPLIQMQGEVNGFLTSTPFNRFFSDAWRVAHQLEAAPGADGRTWYMLGRWAPGGGDVVGTLTLDRDVPYSEGDVVGHLTGGSPIYSSSGTLHEQTTITLRHTPDPSLASGN